MKKILPLVILLVALPFAISSCSDDNDLPNVDYSISFSGATLDSATGTLYVTQGDTLNVESITVSNLESDKTAAVTGAQYYWDYNLIGNSPLPPFGYKIYVSDLTPVGEHQLTIRVGVVAVDKSPAIGIVNYPVKVVAAPSDPTTTPVASTAVVNAKGTLKLKAN